MNRFVITLAAASLVAAPTIAAAQATETPQTQAAQPKKKSSLFGFARRVLEQAGPQIIPQNGSLKGIVGHVALSAVENAGGNRESGGQEGGAEANADGCAGLDAATVAGLRMQGQGGSAAPNAQARAMLGQINAMMASKGGAAAKVATAMSGGGLPAGY